MPRASRVPRILEEISYARAAAEYERLLIPEKHLMESTSQGRQREITMASFALVRAKRPEVHYFNELLVQYRLEPDRTIHGVVPDSMVVISEQPFPPLSTYIVAHQRAKPYWMFEYVSKHNKRKDYERNLVLYEQHLKVPYYLVFYPDAQDLTLFRLREGRYQSVLPNKRGRLAIPKLEIEVALLDEWVRYWFCGELLLLPEQLAAAREQDQQRATEATQLATEATQRATEATQFATEAEKRAQAAESQATKDRQALTAAQEELARLRAQLAKDA